MDMILVKWHSDLIMLSVYPDNHWLIVFDTCVPLLFLLRTPAGMDEDVEWEDT